ncbi:MAG: alpha/beta fold hydrolase, partial [Myxococcota bacterium]
TSRAGPRGRAKLGAMRIQVGDVRLFFDVEGAGLVPEGPAMRGLPTLLLLHGGPGFDHSAFKPAFAQLRDVAQVIYLDHRGQGRSDRSPPETWNLAHWADDVRAFCEALEIERPIVLGQSFGGMVAMVYAARHPEHAGGLVLSSTAARWVAERSVRVFERLGGPEVAKAAQRFWADPGPENMGDYARLCMPRYSRTAQDPDGLARTKFHLELTFAWEQGEGATLDLRKDLERVRCPTLVLAGDDDPVTPIEAAEEIVDSLPPGRARYEHFADAGHGVYRDRPDDYFRVLREFLASSGG